MSRPNFVSRALTIHTGTRRHVPVEEVVFYVGSAHTQGPKALDKLRFTMRAMQSFKTLPTHTDTPESVLIQVMVV